MTPTKVIEIETDTGKVLIAPAHGISGQVAFTMTYTDRSKAMLIGRVHGKPGEVVLVMQKWVSRILVDDPERFGTKFDEQWVINFVTNTEVSAEATDTTEQEAATS